MGRGRVVAARGGSGEKGVAIPVAEAVDLAADCDVEQVPVRSGPSLEERVEDLGLDLMADLPLREYSTGNTGVEMHVKTEMFVDGELLPVSIHCRVVIVRKRRRRP